MNEIPGLDKTILESLVTTQMPFGKYKGRLLYQLPEAYLVWFRQKGFPKGRLGQQLQTLDVIKENGLDGLLINLAKMK